MSDAVYSVLTTFARPAFWVSSRPTVLNAQATDRPGPYLLAANHTSPYDVPILMRHCRRQVDFLSTTEVFRNPVARTLYSAMNAFPLDRSRPDAPAVRTILDRLNRGRVVGMFPEGGFRIGDASVVHSRRIRPGIGRLARIAGVPVVPCVIVGSANFGRVRSWLPLRHTRYGVAFGEAIGPGVDTEDRLVDALVGLHGRLTASMDRPKSPEPG